MINALLVLLFLQQCLYVLNVFIIFFFLKMNEIYLYIYRIISVTERVCSGPAMFNDITCFSWLQNLILHETVAI